jgi:HEPN domain-containing protein
VNRKELQALAEARLKDADLLYRNRRFDGAYYLAGYVIECALKACIAKRTKRHDFPDKDLAQSVYTHDLTALLKAANLAGQLKQEFGVDPRLEAHWVVVKDWSERSRYETQGRMKAKGMLEAVAHPQGVFACIKRFW